METLMATRESDTLAKPKSRFSEYTLGNDSVNY